MARKQKVEKDLELQVIKLKEAEDNVQDQLSSTQERMKLAEEAAKNAE